VDFRLVAAGLLVGIIAGMSGIGGSSLLAPILILVFGVKASIAVGTDLIYSVLTVGALPGAYLGARLCARLGESTLRPVVIGVLAFAGVKRL